MNSLTCDIREFGGDGVLSVTVSFARFDGDRDFYRYAVRYAGETFAEGEDLSGPGAYGVKHVEMLETLLSFLEAAGESYGYNGNRVEQDSNTDLFPEKTCEIAYMMADEIGMARLELEGNEEDS